MFTFDFASPYLIYVVYNAVFFLSVYCLFKKKDSVRKHQGKLLVFAGIILAYTQVVRYIVPLFEGDLKLPLYVSRLSALLLFFYTLSRKERLHTWLYFWCSTGFLAVLIPAGPIGALGRHDETYFIDHYFIALVPFFLLAAKDYRPSAKKARQALIPLGIIFFTIPFFSVYFQWDYFLFSAEEVFQEVLHTVAFFGFLLLKLCGLYLLFRVSGRLGESYYQKQHPTSSESS